jgi:hypothetical protein
VGALVLALLSPFTKGITGAFPWKIVILTTSALLGGLMIVLVPNGPYRNKAKALICLL